MEESEFAAGIWTRRQYQERLSIEIRDYQSDEYEGSVIWSRDVSLDDVRSIFDGELDTALWQNLN